MIQKYSSGLNAIITLVVVCIFSANLHAQSSQVYIEQTIQEVDSLRKRGDFAVAWSKLYPLANSLSQMSDWQLGMYYKLTAVRLVNDSKHDEAMQASGKARYYFNKTNTPKAQTEYLYTYISTAISYYKRGRLSEAIDTLQYLENIVKSDTSALPVLLSTYTMLGNVLERQEKYEEAIRYVSKSLDAYEQDGLGSSSKAGFAQNTLGTIYQRLGRYENAKQAYQRAYEIFEATYGKNDSRTQSALSNRAIAEENMGMVDRSIKPYIDRLEILYSNAVQDRLMITNTLINLGSSYKKMGEIALAEKYTSQALTTWRQYNQEPHVKEVNILRQLAALQLSQGNIEACRNSIAMAERVNDQLENKQTKEYVALELLKGSFLSQLRDFEGSVGPYQNAYYLSKKFESGFIEDIIDVPFHYLNALCKTNNISLAKQVLDTLQADFSREKHKLSADVSIKTESILALIRLKIQFIQYPNEVFPEEQLVALEKAAQKTLSFSGRLRGRKNKEALYSSNYNPSVLFGELAGIYTHNAILQPAQRQAYLKKALGYIDIQLSYLKASQESAKSTALAPHIRREAQVLGQQIAAYEQLIYELKDDDPEALSKRKEFQQSIISLEERLEEMVPIHASDTTLNREIPLHKLDKSQCFAVFVSAFNTDYVIVGFADDLSAKKIAPSVNASSKISAYLNFVKNPEVGFSESLPLLANGNALYTELLEWAWKQRQIPAPAKIAIIISKPIVDLPFAALPTDVPPGASSYRDISFAIQQHQFSYHLTPGDLVKDLLGTRKNKSIKLLGLAPSSTAYASVGGQYEEPIAPSLSFATEEVEKIVQATSGVALLGANATLEDLRSQLPGSNVFHFATHATSNSQTPAFSYILLADSTGNYAEKLYARVISELNFPADLVVLSACESGDANLVDGIGASSLASVFLDAGASNVLNSLWKIDDRQAQEIMLQFYAALQEGKEIDLSLAEAQRTYLKTSGSQYLHPYYWAAFSTIGNPQAVVASTNWWLVLATLLPISLGLLYFLRRNTTLPQHASRPTP